MSPRLAGMLALACGSALMAVLLGACASSQAGVSMAPPASPAEGRQQLDDLEGQIARDRVALGLSPHTAFHVQGQTARQDGAAGPADAADAAEVRPSAPPPPAPSAEPVSAGKRKAAEEAEAPCNDRGPCRYTRAICNAAERICAIAAYLADDDARRRCTRARQDCAEARETTRATCPGC